MTQAAKAQEPSMEEILASIRRIIADDDAVKSPPAPPEPPRAPPVAAAAAPLRPVAAAPAAPAPEFVPLPTTAAEPSVNETVLDEMLAGLKATTASAADAEDRAAKAMAGPASPSAPGFRTVEGSPEHFTEPSAAHDGPQMPFPERPLMSAATSAAVDSAFNKLAQTVRVQNARTLEDVIKDMLQPLLKSWLDGNLPGLVEQLVRAEIERISRRRG
jgi:cell pole-organizing protein PopZ